MPAVCAVSPAMYANILLAARSWSMDRVRLHFRPMEPVVQVVTREVQ